MELTTLALQTELLKMVKELHRVCVENNISYFLIEGTALGACRHEGFIPWDDDIDVGMPRDDYNRFCEAAQNILPENLELLYYKNHKKSPFHFAKLINNKTTLIEKGYKDYVEGIYIDIFPLDYLSELTIKNRIRSRLIWRIHSNIIYHCTTDALTGKPLWRKFDIIISKMLNLSMLHRVLEKLMTAETKDNAIYLCNYLGAYHWMDIIPVSFFGNPKTTRFEDANLYVPERIEDYLSHLYGDFRQLPPVEQRVSKHDYHYVNLQLPYREYQQRNQVKLNDSVK